MTVQADSMQSLMDPRVAEPSSPPPAPGPQFELIELLFFAYRDFVGDPDRILEQYGFGRAHHRVLHFVHRNPGLTIAALLDILKITKQSLNRVLKELIEKGYVEQRAGLTDRRQRLLFPTARGEALALDLARLQTDRITRAIAESGPTVAQAASQFLRAMIDPADRPDPLAGPSGQPSS
jgi:DNA-binding MarR family transcriptional regulator